MRLPTPSNYVGPAKVFGVPAAGSTDEDDAPALPIVRHVDDYEDLASLTDTRRIVAVGRPADSSLREAMSSFVLACAARRARGQTAVHNSMLIHVTRFVDVQAQVADRVSEELEEMRRRIRLGEGASGNTASRPAEAALGKRF